MGIFKKSPEEKTEAREAFKAELGKVKESAKSQRDVIRQAMFGDFPDVSPQRLFNAVMLSAAERRYSVASIDRASFSVTFQTNKGEKFWDGKISCFVLPSENGCQLSVAGNSEKGSTSSGFSIQSWSPFNQLASDGAVGTEVNRFKVAIIKKLEKTPEPAPESSPSSNTSSDAVDIPSQLRQIKELFDSGVLTQDEFEKAKAKLLN